MNSPRRLTDAELIARSQALPVPDNDNIDHWCCIRCDSENVHWETTGQRCPSGVRRLITCANGHTTMGYPRPRFRISSPR